MFKIMSKDTVFSRHETLDGAKKEMGKRRDDRDEEVDRLMEEIDKIEIFYSGLRVVHED